MNAPWIRPVAILTALVILFWMAFMFLSGPRITMKDTVWDETTNDTVEWEGEVSCTSLVSFSDGRVAHYDWMIDDDGSTTMKADFEDSVQHACGGARATRAMLIGIAASPTLLLFVVAKTANRRRAW